MALYEHQRDPAAQDDDASFGRLVSDYGIEWKRGWLIELQKELLEEGMIRGPSNGSNDAMATGRLSGRGLSFIERNYGALDGVSTLISKVADQTTLSPSDATSSSDADEPTIVAHDPRVIRSADWTGLPESFEFTAEKQAALVRNLDIAEAALSTSDVSQESRAQVRAYIIAIRALAEAPDPPKDIIWELIGQANTVAGIASLFVSIIALFA